MIGPMKQTAIVDPDRLRALVAEGLSIRRIASELGVGYSTVRYWLGKLGLETAQGTRRRESEAARKAGLQKANLLCPKHGHVPFLARREGGYRCSKCNIVAVSRRRRQVKRILVEEAGGECRLCGFSEHPAALQFHHLDPTSKTFHLAQHGHSLSLARMRVEAGKCVLLCANCHALVEAGVKNLPVSER
jgi:transposase-like protein